MQKFEPSRATQDFSCRIYADIFAYFSLFPKNSQEELIECNEQQLLQYRNEQMNRYDNVDMVE